MSITQEYLKMIIEQQDEYLEFIEYPVLETDIICNDHFFKEFTVDENLYRMMKHHSSTDSCKVYFVKELIDKRVEISFTFSKRYFIDFEGINIFDYFLDVKLNENMVCKNSFSNFVFTSYPVCRFCNKKFDWDGQVKYDKHMKTKGHQKTRDQIEKNTFEKYTIKSRRLS
jgi:hypothetical protein